MPVFGDHYRVRVCCYTPTQIALNILYARCDAITGVGASDADLAAKVVAMLHGPYKAWMSDQARFRGADVQKLRPLPVGLAAADIGQDGPGVQGSPLLPTQVCGVISTYSTTVGPRSRGRLYPGFPPVSYADTGGSMNNTGITQLTTLRNAFFTVLWTCGSAPDTSDMRWEIQGHSYPGGGGPGVVTGYVVSAFVPRVRFATQRKRGQYGQTNILPF